MGRLSTVAVAWAVGIGKSGTAAKGEKSKSGARAEVPSTRWVPVCRCLVNRSCRRDRAETFDLKAADIDFTPLLQHTSILGQPRADQTRQLDG